MPTEFVIECFTELALGIFIIGLRIYSRCITKGPSNLDLDDYGMVFAAIPYTGLLIAAWRVQSVFDGMANINMTAEYRANLSPTSKEYDLRTRGSQNHLIGWYVYVALLWTFKSCMVIFYTRLTSGVSKLRTYVKFVMACLFVTYLIVNLTITLDCRPFPRHWQINPYPGDNCQVPISLLNLMIVLIPNIITDLLLLSIPVLLIYMVQMPFKKKLVLSAMFSGSIFVMAAGILRCALVIAGGTDGAAQSGNWAIREAFVAVITSNVPMIQSLIRHWVRVLRKQDPESSSYANHYSGNEGSKGTRLRSYATEQLSESAEHIVGIGGSSNDDAGSLVDKPDNGIHVTTKTVVANDTDFEAHELKHISASKLGLPNTTAYRADISTKNKQISE